MFVGNVLYFYVPTIYFCISIIYYIKKDYLINQHTVQSSGSKNMKCIKEINNAWETLKKTFLKVNTKNLK